jgi:hypothetical protein
MDPHESRQHWPRITLTLPPEAGRALDELARIHFRDRRREALRLLVDGIERERLTATDGAARR